MKSNLTCLCVRFFYLKMKLSDFKQINIVDHAYDLSTHLTIDSFLEKNHKADELTVRFWVSKGVVFGKLDSILPNFLQGEEYINSLGYPTVIRKAGGLAVVLDEGTMNLSFIFSKQQSLLASYKIVVLWMIDFFKLSRIEIEVKEVSDSYCPGKYDLVYQDKKFCGIAQIRTKENVIVMLNLVLSGDQKKRLETIKGFYEIANTENNPIYPQININSMQSLNVMDNNTFKQLFKNFLKQSGVTILELDKK